MIILQQKTKVWNDLELEPVSVWLLASNKMKWAALMWMNNVQNVSSVQVDFCVGSYFSNDDHFVAKQETDLMFKMLNTPQRLNKWRENHGLERKSTQMVFFHIWTNFRPTQLFHIFSFFISFCANIFFVSLTICVERIQLYLTWKIQIIRGTLKRELG